MDWLITLIVIIAIFMCGAVNMVLEHKLHEELCSWTMFHGGDNMCTHEFGGVAGFALGPLLLIPVTIYVIARAVMSFVATPSDKRKQAKHQESMAELARQQQLAEAKLKLKRTQIQIANGSEYK